MTKATQTVKYTTFKDVAELDKEILNTCKAAHTLQARIQNVSVAILLHAYQHGDWTRCNTLVHGLPDGIKRKALVEWFVKFGGLVIDEGAKEFTSWNGKEHVKANFEEAKSVMWWTFAPEKPFAGFDLKTELTKLLDKATKAQATAAKLRQEGKAGEADKVQVQPEQLAIIKNMLNSVNLPLPGDMQ